MRLPQDQIASNDDSHFIVSKIYQREPISVVSEVYRDFTDLILTKRGMSESNKNIESPFGAQLSKFDCNRSSIKFPEELSTLMLLSNSRINDGQRVSVLLSVP